MKKLFISQPMKDKSLSDIQDERVAALKAAQELAGEELALLKSYNPDYNMGTPLSGIAQCIELLGQADVVYFVDGWKKARGCRIEHACAVEYDIPILDD